MLDFIMDIVELVWAWIFVAFFILLIVYFAMDRVARHLGCGNLFDQYIETIVEWIRDAFR